MIVSRAQWIGSCHDLVELDASVIVHEERVSVRVAAERSHSRDNSGSATAASPPSVCCSLDQTPRSDRRQRKTRSDRRRHKPSRRTRSVRSPPETHTHGSVTCLIHAVKDVLTVLLQHKHDQSCT